MAMFRRKNKSNDPTDPPGEVDAARKPAGWRRPANTAFKQQRLKAWQPILSPKTVIPTLFIIAILFAPIGGLLIWGSSLVSSFRIDYTECNTQAPTDGSFKELPSSKFSYSLRHSDSKAAITAPQWSFKNDTSASDVSKRARCTLRFNVPADMDSSVFMYYGLTKFYQNHRRYVKSYNANQLKGDFVSTSTLNSGDCKPLGTIDGKAVYPCGLIANSLFNDTFDQPRLLSNNQTYNFTDKGIAWSGEAKKYTNKPDYDVSQIVPPPNWALRFPDGYNSSNIPQLHDDQHFQNWMRIAGLSDFTKLYFRNDNETMTKGDYEIDIYMNYPVTIYGGTKSIVISTVSWIGGKNPFMGWAFVATAAVFIVLAVAALARHLVAPRKLGDMSLLSWNQPQHQPTSTVAR